MEFRCVYPGLYSGLQDATDLISWPHNSLNPMLPIHPINREQVEAEARAKVVWGDAREEVLKYLMIQGLSAPEATALADEMYQERAASIRAIGLKKFIMGIPLMAVPVAAWFYFLSIRVMSAKLLGLAMVIGLYGAYLFLKGMIMFVSPKSEPGDVGDK